MNRNLARCALLSVLMLPRTAVAAQTEPSPPSGPAEASLGGARQLVGHGEFKEAEKELRILIQGDPKSPEAAFLLGYVLLRMNKPKESLEEYTRGAALQSPLPPSAEDLRHVADDYVLLNDLDDADKWMLTAVRADSKDAEGWYGLGRIRYTEQRFVDAVPCFEKALKLAPRSVKAGDNLALAYDALNRRAEAIEEWKKVLRWQADSSKPSEQPMLNLAIVYVEQGQFEEASPLLVQALAIAPGNAKIHEQLGDVDLQTDKLAEAQREFEEAVSLSPDSAGYHFLLGRVLKREGLESRAKAEFDRAAALNGTHSTPDSRQISPK